MSGEPCSNLRLTAGRKAERLRRKWPRRGPALLAIAASVLMLGTSVPSRGGSASGLAADKGKFVIRVNGQDAGTEVFEISRSGDGWTAHGASDIRTQEGNAKVTATLTLRADGTPARYEWSSEGPKKASAAVSFQGATAVSELHLEGRKPYTQSFTFPSPRILILDNNLYDQYIILARLYDRAAAGPQTFSVLVPQELTPGTVTVQSLGAQDSGGRKMEELRVRTSDNEVDLYLDSGRLMRIVAPAANAEIVRQ